MDFYDSPKFSISVQGKGMLQVIFLLEGISHHATLEYRLACEASRQS